MPATRATLPRRLSAPAPGWTTSADVVVVGSGIAGLTCALRLRERVDRVLLVTKTVLSAGSTAWAQGGIAAALDPEDTPQEHLDDTLVAGVGLCDAEAVRILVTEGPERVRELVALGAEFDRDAGGEIKLTREGGHHRDRIAHAGGDATGAEISRALIAALHRVVDDPGIEVVEHALVVDLLTADDGAVCGVTLHVIGEGQVDGVGAAYGRAVVLATGGLGQIYTSTTNPPVATGDGMAAALRAGARVTDLEFVQFHPTVLFLGEGSTGQQPLISEAVRGEGAFLVDDAGLRIMQGRHELGRPRTARRRGPGDPRRDARPGRRPRLARRPAPRCGVPGAALPVDRGPVPRARVRPGHRAAAGGTGPALRVGRGRDRPPRALVARRAVRVRGVLVHRGPRGQPARVELAARGPRLRAPHRRRRHRAARGRRAAAARAVVGGRRRGRARRLAPPRRAAGDDPRLRAGAVGSVDPGRPSTPSPPSRPCRRPRPSPGRPRGRRPTCCTSARPSRSSRTCARRPAAGTCARTSPSATTSTGCAT